MKIRLPAAALLLALLPALAAQGAPASHDLWEQEGYHFTPKVEEAFLAEAKAAAGRLNTARAEIAKASQAEGDRLVAELAKAVAGHETFTVKGKPQRDPCADLAKPVAATPGK